MIEIMQHINTSSSIDNIKKNLNKPLQILKKISVFF